MYKNVFGIWIGIWLTIDDRNLYVWFLFNFFAPPQGPSNTPVGADYPTMPSGCVTQSGIGGMLFLCGATWPISYFEGNKIVHDIISAL